MDTNTSTTSKAARRKRFKYSKRKLIGYPTLFLHEAHKEVFKTFAGPAWEKYSLQGTITQCPHAKKNDNCFVIEWKCDDIPGLNAE